MGRDKEGDRDGELGSVMVCGNGKGGLRKVQNFMT